MKKAFTLTELLIVVLVLGVLATVSTPKMKKMLETRKTTEAEEMLSAVRMEQEKRCALGKEYHTDPAKVSVMASAANSKNYNYSLTSKGAVASSSSQNYSIEVLSYKDGSLCCRGSYCSQLNKDYPVCPSASSITDECASPIACGEAETSRECPAPAVGTQTRTANCDTNIGQFTYGTWTGACTCDPDTKVISRACPNGTGTQTRTATCDSSTYTWQYGEWTGSCGCDTSTKPSETGTCPSGSCGIKTREVSCNSSTGEWIAGAWSEDCEALPESETRTCNACGTQTVTYSCNSLYNPSLFATKKLELDAVKYEGAVVAPLAFATFDRAIITGNTLSLSKYSTLFSFGSKFRSTVSSCSVADSSTCPNKECEPGEFDEDRCMVCSNEGTWYRGNCGIPDPGLEDIGGLRGPCIMTDIAHENGCTFVVGSRSGGWHCPDGRDNPYDNGPSSTLPNNNTEFTMAPC